MNWKTGYGRRTFVQTIWYVKLWGADQGYAAVLFSGENDFLLIDEPTNHLDQDAREIIKKYLAVQKKDLFWYPTTGICWMPASIMCWF